MSAAPHRDDEILLTSEADRGDDVIHPLAARDDSGTAVGHCVPDNASAVVIRIVRTDQLTAEAIPEARQP